MLVVQKYHYGVAPESVNMDIVTMWARLLNLPPELTIEPTPYEIASNMATCYMVEYQARNELTLTCPRALVEINVNDRLWDHIPINIGKSEKLRVNMFFERLPKGFYKLCRVLNHPRKKCVKKAQPGMLSDPQLDEHMEMEEDARFIEKKLEEIAEAFQGEENAVVLKNSIISYQGESSKTPPPLVLKGKEIMVSKPKSAETTQASFNVGVTLHETMMDSDVPSSKRHAPEEIEVLPAAKL